jgi:hypothetical protein
MRDLKLSAIGEGVKSNKHVWYPPLLHKLPFGEGGAWPVTPPPTHTQFSSPIPRLLGWLTAFGGGGRIGVRGRATMPPRDRLVGHPTVIEGEGCGWGDEYRGGGEVLPRPHDTLSWRGQISNVFWALRCKEKGGNSHNLWLHLNIYFLSKQEGTV